jgi:hypothetical protein
MKKRRFYIHPCYILPTEDYEKEWESMEESYARKQDN